MISDKVRSAIRPTSMLFLMIWAGEFLSFGIYYFVVHLSTSQGDSPVESVDQMLPILFGVMAGGSLLAGLILKWFVFSQRRAQAFLSKQKSPNSDALEDGNLEEQLIIQLAKQTFQPYLMSLGMIHTCVIFGMVLSVMQHDLDTFMPFLAAGVTGAILCFPRLEAFIAETMQRGKVR